MTKQGLINMGFLPVCKFCIEHADGSIFLFDTEQEMENYFNAQNEGEFKKIPKMTFYTKKHDV